MGVWKINPHDFSSYKKAPKELSAFWQTFFAKISIDFSRLYFNSLQKNNRVQFIAREIVKAKDYFQSVNSNSILKAFSMLPHGEIGFIHFSNDLSNYLIHHMLGGIDKNLDLDHELTEVDFQLLESLINEKFEILQSNFLDDRRYIEIQQIDENDILLFANSFQSEQLISLQMFSVEFNGEVYIFTIAMGNRLLEQFISI